MLYPTVLNPTRDENNNEFRISWVDAWYALHPLLNPIGSTPFQAQSRLFVLLYLIIFFFLFFVFILFSLLPVSTPFFAWWVSRI
ncbi:hypothetical protein BDV10DRAFT_175010 [Aspergillus recurvatus]